MREWCSCTIYEINFENNTNLYKHPRSTADNVTAHRLQHRNRVPQHVRTRRIFNFPMNSLKPRKFPPHTWLPARMNLRIEFDLKSPLSSAQRSTLEPYHSASQHIFKFLKLLLPHCSFKLRQSSPIELANSYPMAWKRFFKVFAKVCYWPTSSRQNKRMEEEEEEEDWDRSGCCRRIRRTRKVRPVQEDAVNDFGVPEKSKYSTATKPVLLK